MKKNLLKCTILASFVLCLISCGGTSTYHNDEYGYSFDYPSGWVEEDMVQYPGLIVTILDTKVIDDFRSNLNLIISKLSPDEEELSEEDLFKKASKELNKVFTVTTEKITNGKMIFVYNQGPLRIYQALTVKQGQAFWLTLTVLNDEDTSKENDELFETIVQSIKCN